MRKKIVLLSNHFPPTIDGVADYTFHLGEVLAKESEIYYLNKQSLCIEKWNIQGFKKAYQKIKAIKPQLISLQYVPFGFHHKGISFTLSFFWVFLRLKGYYLQVTFHEVAIGFNYRSIRQSIGALGQRIIAWALCLFSQHVFTSVGLYYRMLKPFNKNTQQVLIGSNLPILKKTIENNMMRLCSFNNRINKQLLEVVSELSKENDQFKLIGIGKIAKHLKIELENIIKSLKIDTFVELQEPASAPDLAFQLACADIYIQLEGDGGVSLKSGALIAAMSHQLPIITTFGKMTDLNLINTASGVVSVNTSNKNLYSTLQDLIDDSSLRHRLSLNAKDFYFQNCTWEKIAMHYHTLIHD